MNHPEGPVTGIGCAERFSRVDNPVASMTLGNMRDLGGVQNLIASCLNDACRHTALIDVWSYPAETEIPYFRRHVVCAKCGSRGNKIDVRPNWKEQPPQSSLTGKVFR
jgi:transposase